MSTNENEMPEIVLKSDFPKRRPKLYYAVTGFALIGSFSWFLVMSSDTVQKQLSPPDVAIAKDAPEAVSADPVVDEGEGEADVPPVVQEITWSTVEELKALADEGTAEAQYQMGKLYAEGEVVEQDALASMNWVAKAGLQGHAKAQHTMGLMYEKGFGVSQSIRDAIDWHKAAAKQGHVEAQYRLGLIHYEKVGLVLDSMQDVDAVAVEYLILAAEGGHAEAQFLLGYIFRLGNTVTPVDSEIAFFWFTQSAVQGSMLGQRELGRAYLYGDGVPANRELAIKWLEASAAQGSIQASQFLDTIEGYVNPFPAAKG